jgi:hypothetical protein
MEKHIELTSPCSCPLHFRLYFIPNKVWKKQKQPSHSGVINSARDQLGTEDDDYRLKLCINLDKVNMPLNLSNAIKYKKNSPRPINLTPSNARSNIEKLMQQIVTNDNNISNNNNNLNPSNNSKQ